MAVKLSQLKIDKSTLGEGLICVETALAYAYEDNKRTDKVVGVKYVCIVPALTYDKITVTVEGQTEPIKELAEVTGPVNVEFEDLDIKAYFDSNKQLQLSVKASAVEVV